MSEEENKGQVSSFNEASLKMIRIHESQRLVNRLRINMLAFDNETRRYFYELMIAELLSLQAEVKSKMSLAEKNQAEEWRNKVTYLQDNLNLKRRALVDAHGKKQIKTWIDLSSWNVLRPQIFNMEDFVRDMLEKHGMSSPNQEMEALWD